MKNILFAALFLCGAACVLSAAPLKIGWASAPIHDGKTHTQIFGQHFLRWDRDGVLDPLTATCLVIDNGEDQLIFLSVDTTSFGYGNPPGPHIMKLLTKIAPDVPQEKIISGATHTHTAGDMENRPIQKYLQDKVGKENKFTDYALDAIAGIIKRAWENRKPGRVAYGFSYAVVGHQRRAVYFTDRSKRPNATPSSSSSSTFKCMPRKERGESGSQSEASALSGSESCGSSTILSMSSCSLEIALSSTSDAATSSSFSSTASPLSMIGRPLEDDEPGRAASRLDSIITLPPTSDLPSYISS